MYPITPLGLNILTLKRKFVSYFKLLEVRTDLQRQIALLQLNFHLGQRTKGTGKRRHIVADTLLPTQMFLRLLARATFVAATNFVSGTQKCF